MEPKYIFAIVALSIFLVLFIIFFAVLAHKRKMEAKLQAWLYEVYSDKNLVKMDYDTSDEDEPVRLSGAHVQTEAVKAEEVRDEIKEELQQKVEGLYDKIEIEGIEEITGNYKPQ